LKKYIHKIKQKTSKVNKFAVDTVLYTFGDLLNKGIVFLTIPIFSRMLSTEDYGILSIYQLLFGVLVVLITLNIPGAVTQRLFENKENEDSFISTNFKFIILFSAFFAVLLVLIEYFFSISVIIGLPQKYYYLCVFDSFLIGILGFYQAMLLGKRNSKSYVINSILSSGGGVLISIVLMLTIFNFDELLGRFVGKMLVPLVFFFIVTYSFKDSIKSSFKKNREFIMYSASFGIPLIPHLLSNLVLRQFDRIIINTYMGLASTGIFSLASNLSFILPVLIGSVNKSWVPIFQDHLRNARYNEITAKVKNISSVFLIVCILLTLLSDLIFKIVAPAEYYEGHKVFQLLVFGSYFLFAYNAYVNYAYYTRKTYSIAIITLVIGALSLLFNFMLIPKYFMDGAAYSFIIVSILMFFIHFINVKYFLKIKCISPKIFLKHSSILGVILFFSTYFTEFLFENNLGLVVRLLVSLFVIIYAYKKKMNSFIKIK
jgi:O-antigen/teichoic acid export membrane protein